MQLNQKEMGLIKDLKEQEQLCIEKYQKHSEQARDPQLRQLFSDISQVEQQHFETLTKLENGSVPSVGAKQSGQSSSSSSSFSAVYGISDSMDKQHDRFLCSDLLAGEKHVSDVYNTCLFEFKDPQVRQVLNHIQTEEQHHGEQLYGYMSVNGMYNC